MDEKNTIFPWKELI